LDVSIPEAYCTVVEAVPARELTVETSPSTVHTCGISPVQTTPMAMVHHASRRMGQLIWDVGLSKLSASRLTLWRGPEISEVESYVGGVDSPDGVESFFHSSGIFHGVPPALHLAKLVKNQT
jgi:hypothetical protein